MKKLQLNKKTIASLSKDNLLKIKGGFTDSRLPPCGLTDGATYSDVNCISGQDCLTWPCGTMNCDYGYTEKTCGGPGPSGAPTGCAL